MREHNTLELIFLVVIIIFLILFTMIGILALMQG